MRNIVLLGYERARYGRNMKSPCTEAKPCVATSQTTIMTACGVASMDMVLPRLRTVLGTVGG
jgi:hypothetical protein